jgi:hypothetical protein
MSIFRNDQYNEVMAKCSQGEPSKASFKFDRLNLDDALGISRKQERKKYLSVPMIYNRCVLTGKVKDVGHSRYFGFPELSISIEKALDVENYPNILSDHVGGIIKVTFRSGIGEIKKGNRISLEIEGFPSFPAMEITARTPLEEIGIFK